MLVSVSSTPDLPIACTLDADALRTRREGLLAALLATAAERTPLSDGYAFRFDPCDGILDLIARVVDAERRCCRFLRFEIAVEPDTGPIRVTLTGPAGTREFLAATLGL